jgi:hypothetical protein
LFIPDPDADFLPILDPGPGVKKAPDLGSGSATLVTICPEFYRFAVIYFVFYWFFLNVWTVIYAETVRNPKIRENMKLRNLLWVAIN